MIAGLQQMVGAQDRYGSMRKMATFPGVRRMSVRVWPSNPECFAELPSNSYLTAVLPRVFKVTLTVGLADLS
jgi:hypothetical protein